MGQQVLGMSNDPDVNTKGKGQMVWLRMGGTSDYILIARLPCFTSGASIAQICNHSQ
jgi:hypothetical protein